MMQRVCFAEEASEEDLARLGSREQWLVYRELVRGRLEHVTAVALSRTRKAVGESTFGSAFGGWLAGGGPESRYLREVPIELASHAIAEWEQTQPPWVADLARFEIAEWSVRHAPPVPNATEAFRFDRPPQLSRALRVLRLAHPVHRAPTPARGYDAEPTLLCVYRGDDHTPKAKVLNEVAADLLESWSQGAETVTQSVERTAAAHELEITPAFVEKLSTLIAEFLGGHSPPPNPPQ